ncbi:MAG: hypothetical protein ABI729_06385, partial [Chitinophagales bacterium]
MIRMICLMLIATVVISCTKENQKITTYYDLENKSIREVYSVRADSPSIREGEYLLYGKDGNLVERRNYLHNQIQDTLFKYYASGKMSEKALFANGIGNGERKVFYESGPVMIIEHYDKGQFEGTYQTFFENGHKKESGQYHKNVMTGKWEYYYDTGELKEEVMF